MQTDISTFKKKTHAHINFTKYAKKKKKKCKNA